MSRRSLKEIQAGRDPNIFANNVRRMRLELGLTKVQLADGAKVSRFTITRIEAGKGCTPSIERKLARFFTTAEGLLWQPQKKRYHVLRQTETDRWFFADADECSKFMARHHLLENQVLRRDPDEIQGEEERLRLGRSHQSCAFLRLTSALLEARCVSSSVLEIYDHVDFSETPTGDIIYWHCLRGSLCITLGEETFPLKSGDVLVLEKREDLYFVQPTKPIGPKDLPPLAILLGVETANKSPHPIAN